MSKLSIIIVNYKNQDLITACVQSIVENERDLDFEIIVVDNNSMDDSENVLKEVYPNVKWIQMGYNSGFGRANNAGMKAAVGEYLLLLNSDVVVKAKNSISQCLHHLEKLPDAKTTILGTRLVNEDGSYQETLRLSFPGIGREIRANAFYILIVERLFKKKFTEKAEQKSAHYLSGKVAWINGAFLLMNRASALEKKLLFDEDFFLYGEDMEWGWRANKSGMAFYHWHEQELTHIGSASSTGQDQKLKQVMASDWLYLRKTRGFFYTFFTMTFVWKNQLLDGLLHFFARIRGKSFSEAELLQKDYRKWTKENLKRFYFMILFKKKLSDERTFKINCYK